MKGLTKGRGSFELHSSLVVIRGWWIDECKIIDDNMFIQINDDYFDQINNNNPNINEFSDLIDSPLTLPIYDHFIVPTECEHIHGIITNYKHNIKNEKLTLIIDIENSSPLMFFNDAKFNIKQMSLIKLSNNNNNNNINNNSIISNSNLEERRRLKSIDFSLTIPLPIPNIYYVKDLEIENRQGEKIKFGECIPDISPYVDIGIGFSLDYTLKYKFPFNIEASLNSISARLNVEAGVTASLECNFFEALNGGIEDGKIDVEIFSQQWEFGKYSATIGPVIITVSPFVEIGAVLTRPALGIVLKPEATISQRLTIITGIYISYIVCLFLILLTDLYTSLF